MSAYSTVGPTRTVLAGPLLPLRREGFMAASASDKLVCTKSKFPVEKNGYILKPDDKMKGLDRINNKLKNQIRKHHRSNAKLINR